MIEIRKDAETEFYIVLHRFKGSIVGVEQKLFPTKQTAEDYVTWMFDNDPALDYKDSFYVKKITLPIIPTPGAKEDKDPDGEREFYDQGGVTPDGKSV